MTDYAFTRGLAQLILSTCKLPAKTRKIVEQAAAITTQEEADAYDAPLEDGYGNALYGDEKITLNQVPYALYAAEQTPAFSAQSIVDAAKCGVPKEPLRAFAALHGVLWPAWRASWKDKTMACLLEG